MVKITVTPMLPCMKVCRWRWATGCSWLEAGGRWTRTDTDRETVASLTKEMTEAMSDGLTQCNTPELLAKNHMTVGLGQLPSDRDRMK